MRFIASSKYLAAKLKSVEFDNSEYVTQLVYNDKILLLMTNKKTIELDVEMVGGDTAPVIQISRRWDWVSKLMKQINEQPVVIHALDNVTNVLFQY